MRGGRSYSSLPSRRCFCQLAGRAAGVVAVDALLQGQSPPPDASQPSFAVASIKPSMSRRRRSGLLRRLPGGQTYIGDGVSVKLLLATAFSLAASQIGRVPDWVDTEFYDFQAKTDGPESTDILNQMLRGFLFERCKLREHTEKKQMPVFVLTQDAGGVRAQRSQSSSNEYELSLRLGRVLARNVPLADFARALTIRLDRPTVDETGVNESFDFRIQWTPGDDELMRPRSGVGAAPVDGSFAELVSAIRKQLGLKLESKRRQMDFHVIDHIERPTSN